MEPLDWARVPYATLTRDKRVQGNIGRWLSLQEQAGRVVRKRADEDYAVFEAFPRESLRTLALDTVEFPDLATQMARLRGGTGARPWTPASRREALGVPAIFRAASLIANTTGSLSMRALRNEVELPPQDRPTIVVRPDPNRPPRDFFRDTAWNLAVSGEAWWYVAKRDGDGLASALYNVPDPAEVRVEPDPSDPVRPYIEWRGKSTRDGTLRREDLRQLTFLVDSTGLRGVGPLQFCRAATSVSVESTNWAANFYASGGYPSIWIKTAVPLSGDADSWNTEAQTDAGAESEADRIKLQWIASPPNTPRVTDDSIDSITQFDVSQAGAQMLDSRNFQTGEACRMFGIPGALMEYQAGGSSLTYQNREEVWTDFVRSSLHPNYLEPIEGAMSDLLTRSTVSRFNTETIEAPDVKTRFEVYQLAMEIFGPQDGAAYARKREGLAPGNVENAPIPFSQPVAVPALAASRAMRDVRCPRCQRLVVRAVGAVEGWCRFCKAPVAADDGPVRIEPDRRELSRDDFLKLAAIMNRPAAVPDVNVTNHYHEGAFRSGDVHLPPTVIEPAAVNVTVQPSAALVNIEVPEPRPMRREIERDENDRIVAITEAR